MLTQAQIKQIIPHRAPFLLIDKVRLGDSGLNGTAEFDLNQCQPFWQAGPLNELMSPTEQKEALLLEAAAQSFGVIVGASTEHSEHDDSLEHDDSVQHLLLGFDNVSFNNWQQQQTCIELNISHQGTFGQMFRAKFDATCNDQLIASGLISVMQGVKEG